MKMSINIGSDSQFIFEEYYFSSTKSVVFTVILYLTTIFGIKVCQLCILLM